MIQQRISVFHALIFEISSFQENDQSFPSLSNFLCYVSYTLCVTEKSEVEKEVWVGRFCLCSLLSGIANDMKHNKWIALRDKWKNQIP